MAWCNFYQALVNHIINKCIIFLPCPELAALPKTAPVPKASSRNTTPTIPQDVFILEADRVIPPLADILHNFCVKGLFSEQY